MALVRDAVRVEAVEPLALKGKSEPVPAFRLVEVLPGAHGLARRLDSPMLGRDAELAAAVDACERARARTPAATSSPSLGLRGWGNPG